MAREAFRAETRFLLRRGNKMKTYTVGIVAAAVLMLAAGVGFGIAQAAGNQSDSPVWSIQDQIETGNLPESIQVAQLSQELVPEGNWSGTDWQVSGPIETGNLPDVSEENDLDHTSGPMEGNVHQYWGSDNPSN
jgi:hypothetical protein